MTEKDIIPNILNFIKGINYPLYIVIIKYVVEKYYSSSLKICLMIGIISIILNVIGYTIYSLIIDDFSLFTDCFDFSKKENKFQIIIYFILYILFATSSELTLFLSIFYFSPSLIVVTNLISPLFLFIANAIKNSTKILDIILVPIGFFIALFSALIYNELIILNCCDLNKNTKKFVNERINEELIEIKKNEEFFSLGVMILL